MEVHIEIIGNKTGIQLRPGNPYLLTASTTSLTGEIHNKPDLFQRAGQGYPPSR